MPPRKKPPKTILAYPEAAMTSAIAAVQNQNVGIRKAARDFGVPHSTLINKLKGRVPLKRKMGPNTYLTDAEESLIVSWIMANAKKGFPLTVRNLKETVRDILKSDERKTPFKDHKPGRKWFQSFKKRHPEITERAAESINPARAAVTEEQLRAWFRELKDYLKEENALDILEDPARIFNADESGFRTCPSTGLVLGPKGYKNFYEIKSGSEKECITVLANFSSSGSVVPPMIIYPFKRIPRDIVQNINPTWSVGRSSSGWMNGEAFYGYIGNVFSPWIKEQQIKRPVLLLIDGHRSHLTLNVSKLCREQNILLFALLPNATHILQPADVSVFRPLKDGWSKVVADWKRKSNNKAVTKALFGPLLETVFNEKATETVIKNGFEKCGLFPFNPDAIDYSRCMRDTSRTSAENTLPLALKEDFGIPELLFVESKMKRGRAEEFRASLPSGEWTGDESASELHRVWLALRKHVIPDMPQAGDANIPDGSMDDNPESRPGDAEQFLMEEPEDSPTGSVTDFTRLESHAQTAKQLSNQNDHMQPNQHDNPVQSDFSSPTSSGKMPTNQKYTISPSFHEHVFWPTDSPIKTGKRKQTREKLPHAATSKKWLEYWETKEKEKQEKEMAVKEKKKLQELKKQSKQSEAKKAKPKKKVETDSDTNTSFDFTSESDSDSSFSEISDSDEISTCHAPKNKRTVTSVPSFSVNDYVVVNYEEELFPGIVMAVDKLGASVSTMTMAGLHAWRWPEKPDILQYSNSDILTKIAAPILASSRGHYNFPDLKSIRQNFKGKAIP